MEIGQLDCRVRIEAKQISQDPDYGTEVITWVVLATVWANVEDVPPSRAESVTMGLAVAKNQTRIRLRWRPDINSSMRVVIYRPGPVTYQIVGGPSEIVGRKEYLELMVERISS